MGGLDVLNADRENHAVVSRPGVIRVQGLEDPDTGVGRDLESTNRSLS